jgi:hypothetical protein
VRDNAYRTYISYVRRDHLTMDISDDEKGRIIPLWKVNYLIGYIYPDGIIGSNNKVVKMRKDIFGRRLHVRIIKTKDNQVIKS